MKRIIRPLAGLALMLGSMGCSNKSSPPDPNKIPDLTTAEIAELRTLGDTALKSASAGTKLLAACGASVGRSYYVVNDAAAASEPDEQWVDDGITVGRIILMEGPDGHPKAMFRDTTGELNDAVEDGASVGYALKPNENGDFGVIVFYPSTGLTEVYNVIRNRKGSRIALWTTTKPNMTYFSKSGAFAARCL